MAVTLLYAVLVGIMHCCKGIVSSKLFGSADQHSVFGKQNVFTLFQGEKHKDKYIPKNLYLTLLDHHRSAILQIKSYSQSHRFLSDKLPRCLGTKDQLSNVGGQLCHPGEVTINTLILFKWPGS